MPHKNKTERRMSLYNKSTYTFGMLKQGVYKALDEFSVNGYSVSVTKGIASDIEKRIIAALNMCARRVALSFPLLIKRAEITFTGTGEGIVATLPQDFAKLHSLKIYRVGNISETRCDIWKNILLCGAAKDGDTAVLEYSVKINEFTSETEDCEKINLPDISCDALIYLTAAELCPADCSELYSKLMFKYRDIALNCYNTDTGRGVSRNTFYGTTAGALRGRG